MLECRGMRPAFLLILFFQLLPPLLIAQETGAAEPPPAPEAGKWIIPPEFQESLGEAGLSPEVRPWAAGAAGAASGLLFYFGYRSLSGALETAQQQKPPAEIHSQAFSGAALVFLGACLGIVLKDLLWAPPPPEIISEE